MKATRKNGKDGPIEKVLRYGNKLGKNITRALSSHTKGGGEREEEEGGGQRDEEEGGEQREEEEGGG